MIVKMYYIVPLLLALSLSSCVPRVSEDSPSVAQIHSFSLPSAWEFWQLDPLPFEIAMPRDSVQTSRVSKYRGHDVSGVEVSSHSMEDNPSIWATVPDFFSFYIGRMQGYSTNEEFLESVCDKLKRKEEPGYRIFERWTQYGVNLVSFAPWKCEFSGRAMGSGVSIEYDHKVFVIFLPPGDWGSEGGKYFDIALRSIRPVSESNSSTGS